MSEYIINELTNGKRNSPEQIVYLVKRDLGQAISHQSIYRWIKRQPDRKTLEKGLRRRGKQYKLSSQTWNQTSNKRSIHDRPNAVELLERSGDLEGDTIVGKDHKDRILTHTDRANGLASLSRVLGFNAREIGRKTERDARRIFKGGVRSITYDQGVEFTDRENTEAMIQATTKDKRIKAKIYFADPYRSQQRGRNENLNGLVRDFLPKGTDFKKITTRQLYEIETILNNRPRKRYNWRRPLEQREYLEQQKKEKRKSVRAG